MSTELLSCHLLLLHKAKKVLLGDSLPTRLVFDYDFFFFFFAVIAQAVKNNLLLLFHIALMLYGCKIFLSGQLDFLCPGTSSPFIFGIIFFLSFSGVT